MSNIIDTFSMKSLSWHLAHQFTNALEITVHDLNIREQPEHTHTGMEHTVIPQKTHTFQIYTLNRLMWTVTRVEKCSLWLM